MSWPETKLLEKIHRKHKKNSTEILEKHLKKNYQEISFE